MPKPSTNEIKEMLFAFKQTGAFGDELRAFVGPPQPPPPYAFTEIRTFRISENSEIETEATDEGTIWARIIRTYLEDEGTGLVWWGRLAEAPQVVKLVVDWKDIYQHHHFEESKSFKEIESSWADIVVEPVQTKSYVLPKFEVDRRCAFSKSMFPPIISTILTFHFPPNFDPSPAKKREWSEAWGSFSNATLRSAGGGVSSGTCAGWSFDRRSFIGMIRYSDIPTMKQYLEEAQTTKVLYGGLPRMRELASEGMDIEFTSMFCLEHGWLGSVTETRKHDPNLVGIPNSVADALASTRARDMDEVLKRAPRN